MEDRERDRLGFERDLLKYIERLMVDLRAKIRRNDERLKSEQILLLPDDQVCLHRWHIGLGFTFQLLQYCAPVQLATSH